MVSAVPVPASAVTTVVATRRTAIGALLLSLGAVAGCDLDPSTDDAARSGPRTPDPDTALVHHVLAEIAAMAGLVSSVGAAHPPLRDPMAALGRLHAAHAAALEPQPSTGQATTHGATFANAGAALREVRRREQHLEDRLVDSSVAARSGALARLLASMSAGVAQHLAVLPRTVGS